MKDWLVEIIDQIALGEFLASSSISCGQRFGLIAVDNAVEFMLISYVETYKQLVGGHKINIGGITKKDWDDTKSKFPKLLTFVTNKESALQALEVEISRYHDFRNSLYHSGTPVTTSPDRVRKYSELARKVLEVLFQISLSTTEWQNILEKTSLSLVKNETFSSINWQVDYELVDGFVKFSTSAKPTAQEAIALCLHGYSRLTGEAPTKQSLVQSLARSGHPLSPQILNARLGDLKTSKWLQKNKLFLSATGKKALSKKYLLDN